jgi:hypothetical protein
MPSVCANTRPVMASSRFKKKKKKSKGKNTALRLLDVTSPAQRYQYRQEPYAELN